MNKVKETLTKYQEDKITKVSNKYDTEIRIEEMEVERLTSSIEKLTNELNSYKSKIKELGRRKKREIIEIKNSKRVKKYKNIDIKEGDIFLVDMESKGFTIGSYNVYNDAGSSITVRITIQGETPTQYKLFVFFNKKVYIYNKNRNDFNRSYNSNDSANLLMYINKLNFKDFLNDNSKSFRRELGISNLVD